MGVSKRLMISGSPPRTEPNKVPIVICPLVPVRRSSILTEDIQPQIDVDSVELLLCRLVVIAGEADWSEIIKHNAFTNDVITHGIFDLV